MLVEIQCDKFIKHGEIRKPIQFHAGLNTVIGDDNGSNSVGKVAIRAWPPERIGSVH